MKCNLFFLGKKIIEYVIYLGHVLQLWFFFFFSLFILYFFGCVFVVVDFLWDFFLKFLFVFYVWGQHMTGFLCVVLAVLELTCPIILA